MQELVTVSAPVHELLKAQISVGDLIRNPMLQGAIANALLQLFRAVGKALDSNPQVKAARPYLEFAVILLTAVIAVLKAVLSGDATHAPWEAIISAVLFFIGAKSIPADGIDKVTKKSLTGLRSTLGLR